MFVYRSDIRSTYRAIALAIVCFFTANDIAFSYPDSASRYSLAVPSQINEAEFRERFAVGSFLLAIEGVKHYIDSQVKAEKGIFKKDWVSHRTETVNIGDHGLRGRVKGAVDGLEQVVFIKVAGLLSSTGQPACADLTDEMESSG